MRLEVVYEIYDRYEKSYPQVLVVEGSTLRSCILEIWRSINPYISYRDILEYEISELGRRLTDEELLHQLIQQSGDGDGSDYIFSIKDLDSGKMLYTTGEDPLTRTERKSTFENEPSFEEQKRLYDEDNDNWDKWIG